MGDRFLMRFLDRVLERSADRLGDWTGAEVRREWSNEVDGELGRLDILIVNRVEQALCAIENKVFSSEHSDQLTRYRKALECEYPRFKRNYVFLTPACASPYRKEERAHWRNLGYAEIFNIVQQMVERKDGQTKEGVEAFLHQYAVTLRRNILPDSIISQMARKIYLEHREAMDLIVAHKPNWAVEGRAVFEEAIEEQEDWKLDKSARQYVRFRAADWDRYESTRKGSGWLPESQALMLFEFYFSDRGPYLQLALSPKNEVNAHIREELFETVQQHPKLFKPSAFSLTDNYAILHESDCILDDSDYGVGWDDGSTFAKMKKWIADFAEREFPAMNDVIVNCLRECEAERQA